jgi:hypothetical protein
MFAVGGAFVVDLLASGEFVAFGILGKARGGSI